MRVHNPDYGRDEGEGQLYWLCDGDISFAEERVATFPVVNDGRLHDYVIPVGNLPAWPGHGEVICLRLDPANGPCEVELARFSIVERD